MYYVLIRIVLYYVLYYVLFLYYVLTYPAPEDPTVSNLVAAPDGRKRGERTRGRFRPTGPVAETPPRKHPTLKKRYTVNPDDTALFAFRQYLVAGFPSPATTHRTII